MLSSATTIADDGHSQKFPKISECDVLHTFLCLLQPLTHCTPFTYNVLIHKRSQNYPSLFPYLASKNPFYPLALLATGPSPDPSNPQFSPSHFPRNLEGT